MNKASKINERAVSARSLVLVFAALISEGAYAQQTQTTPPPHRHRHSQAQQQQQQPAAERSGAVPGEPETDGCGLGWQVTDKKTIMASVTRGTTNSIVPPSFGMSSGTMGCAKADLTKRDQESVIYALSNYEPLSMEMAQGRGEYLDAFARTLGCNDAALAPFGRMAQRNFRAINESGKASAVRMFFNVKRQIHADPVLSQGCSA